MKARSRAPLASSEIDSLRGLEEADAKAKLGISTRLRHMSFRAREIIVGRGMNQGEKGGRSPSDEQTWNLTRAFWGRALRMWLLLTGRQYPRGAASRPLTFTLGISSLQRHSSSP